MSEMVNMAPPWPGLTREEIFCAVDTGRPSVVSEHETSTPSGWSELMHQCCDQDPAKRPEFSTIVDKLQLIETSLKVSNDSKLIADTPIPPNATATHANENSESGTTEMITHSGNSKLAMELRSVADRHEQAVIPM